MTSVEQKLRDLLTSAISEGLVEQSQDPQTFSAGDLGITAELLNSFFIEHDTADHDKALADELKEWQYISPEDLFDLLEKIERRLRGEAASPSSP